MALFSRFETPLASAILWLLAASPALAALTCNSYLEGYGLPVPDDPSWLVIKSTTNDIIPMTYLGAGACAWWCDYLNVYVDEDLEAWTGGYTCGGWEWHESNETKCYLYNTDFIDFDADEEGENGVVSQACCSGYCTTAGANGEI